MIGLVSLSNDLVNLSEISNSLEKLDSLVPFQVKETFSIPSFFVKIIPLPFLNALKLKPNVKLLKSILPSLSAK